MGTAVKVRGVRTAQGNPGKPMLEAEASIALRDQLLIELKDIGSAEEAANWAHRVLVAKNSLTAADARQVEDAFRAKLATFGSAADVGEISLPTDTFVLRSFRCPSCGLSVPRGQPLLTASTRVSWRIPSRGAFVTMPTICVHATAR